MNYRIGKYIYCSCKTTKLVLEKKVKHFCITYQVHDIIIIYALYGILDVKLMGNNHKKYCCRSIVFVDSI